MGSTIGVISLKGGVGKTSIVSSLGAALAGFEKKVLLVDANLSAPNLGHHFNIISPSSSLHHVLSGRISPVDAVHEMKNFDVIPSSMFCRANINPLKLKDKLRQLKRKYDFTIIDSSPSLNEETLAVMNASDGLFVVTTPDHPTLSATIKASRMAKKRGTPIIGLILNKFHNKNFELSISDIEELAELPVMAVIPYDINILKSLSVCTPSTIYKPNSDSSDEFKKLAATLIGEKYKQIKLKKFFRWISPPRQDINRTIFYERVFG